MDFIKRYAGIIAILALVIAGVAIFRGGEKIIVQDNTNDIQNQAVVGGLDSGLDNSTGVGSLDFQGIGSRSVFGVAACRVPTGTRATATSTCSVRNNTGIDLYAWANSAMSSTTEITASYTNGSGVQVSGIASSTFIVDIATSTDSATIAGAGDFTNSVGTIVNDWRISTGTRINISSLTATTTPDYGSPFLWRNGEYAVVKMIEETGAATRCGTTAVNGTGCEPATSTRRGFHLDTFFYYSAWNNNR